MRSRHPERLRTFDYIGPHRYFLTFCTIDRRPLFTTSEAVALVLSQILHAASREGFAVIAYCFMPDHVHLLVEGIADAADCRRFLARAKQLAGFHYQRALGAPLWQRYGYERTLRREDETLSVARYIVENPVRAGLVSRPDEYPFTGSAVYTTKELLEAVQMYEAWRPRRSG